MKTTDVHFRSENNFTCTISIHSRTSIIHRPLLPGSLCYPNMYHVSQLMYRQYFYTIFIIPKQTHLHLLNPKTNTPPFTKTRNKHTFIYQNPKQAHLHLPKPETNTPSFTKTQNKHTFIYQNPKQTHLHLPKSETNTPSFTKIRNKHTFIY